MLDTSELQERHSPDCNANQVPDDCDLGSGASKDCNRNGIPDECDMLPRLALTEALTIDLAARIHTATLGDFNGDVRPDLVISGAQDGRSEKQHLAVFLNRGGYKFDLVNSMELQSGQKTLLAADMDGDGQTDVLAETQNGPLIVMHNRDEGAWWVRMVVDEGPLHLGSVRVADFDDNALPDIVGIEQWIVRLYYNDGTAFLLKTIDIPGFCATTAAVGDVDEDADVDILLSNAGCERNDYDVLGGMPLVAFLENTGKGVFAVRFMRLAAPVYGPMLIDIDVDGRRDLRVDRGVFFNLGDAAFGPLVRHGCGFLAQNMDMDGDGDPDFVGGQIACINRGNRTFVRRSLLSFNRVIPGDFDGDGLDDIASYETGKSSLFILLNRTELPEYEDADVDGELDVCGVEFRRGDCTDDGSVNISDAICVLSHLIEEGSSIRCEKSADTDDTGRITVLDAIVIIRLLFATGFEPDGVSFDCGVDMTGDELRCPAATECVVR